MARVTHAAAPVAMRSAQAARRRTAQFFRGAEPNICLYSQGVLLTGGGRRVLLAPAARSVDGVDRRSRVCPQARGETAERARASERCWLRAAGDLVEGPYQDLARCALLDLHVLTFDLPAPVAGWSGPWRYVWPRDAAHAVHVLTHLGLADEAIAAVRFFAGVQRPDGWFEARTTTQGAVPDSRAPQKDGAGWFLWAAAAVLDRCPHRRAGIEDGAAASAARAVRAILADLEAHDGLPGPSADYWEVDETQLTLGTAAALLAGLQAASRHESLCGGHAGRERVMAAADRLAARIREHFGPRSGFAPAYRGYERYAPGGGGARAGYDSALTFLLPPYVTGFEADVGPLLDEAWGAAERPAGGVGPGAGWKDRFVSWTPETALFAQAWAHLGRTDRAREVLTWLDAHRTALGCLPEKVMADGRAAAVAPLAWTCCVTVVTLLALG